MSSRYPSEWAGHTFPVEGLKPGKAVAAVITLQQYSVVLRNLPLEYQLSLHVSTAGFSK